ncbi:MAG: hypothetical protein OXC44_08350 [Proteobacteria bacterium]|nr:hypothetical protein [Pseudomonadota bacterium]
MNLGNILGDLKHSKPLQLLCNHTWDRLLAICVFLCIALSFLRIHFRVQTTVIGYEVAALKDHETKLLEESSHLKMELSKMTRQETLVELSQATEP